MDQVTSDSDRDLKFLADGGAMGERVRVYPWADTPLGPPQFWPQGLRTAVRILLTTGHPTLIFWGPELTCLYNDAFSHSLGPEKHPAILGAPARLAWQEVWPIVGSQIEQVLRGDGAVWHENQCVPIIRHGELQEVYWTYSYNPIDEPTSPHGVGGVLVTCAETTQQVLAERRLAAERERFVRLFDQAPTFLAMLRGQDHVIELANPGFMEVIGQRSVIGRKLADALPDAVAQGYLTLLDEVYRTGKPFSAMGAKYSAQVAPEGPIDERYVDFVYQPITDGDGTISGILVQGVDVTSRTLSDRELALDRARLDYATRLSGVGFWYCDLPFDELEWDDRVKEHFFFPPTARITIDDFYARIHEEDRVATREAIDASMRNRTPYDIVYRTVHPDTGAVKWIRALGGTDYDSDGMPMHFDGVTVDVSAQKLDQERLAALNHQLRELDRRKDEFLATLAHELRNPLAALAAAAHVLSRSTQKPSIAALAQAALTRQVDQMARLLDDLLEISRINNGRVHLQRSRFRLRDSIEAALEMTQPLLVEKRHVLSVNIEDEAVIVDADKVRLTQVFANLLTNAIKYTDANGQIEFTMRRVEHGAEISVRDNGIGIAPESLEQVFEMFSQSEPALQRSQGGLGIGLSLVRGLIRLHDGEVFARSNGLGKGSEFIVRLPIVTDDTALVNQPSDLVETHIAAIPLRILIADDNADAANSWATMLEIEGHEVRVVHDGTEAVALATQFAPHVALLDIGMPGLNGYEVASALRALDTERNMVIVAITGFGSEHDKQRAIGSGFDHHFTKPISPDDLLQLLQRADRSIPAPECH